MLKTHLFFLWFKILLPQPKNLMNGNSNGRWILALIPVKRSKKFFSVENYIKCHILRCFVTMQTFSKQIFIKHRWVELDFKWTFHDHLDIVFNNWRKVSGLLRKLNSILSRAVLVIIFKTFVEPDLHYVMSSMVKFLIVLFITSWNQFSEMHV